MKPEEHFRQKLLNHLIDNLGYDVENIGVEFPMTHHSKGESGRADIVVFDKPMEKRDAKPLIVIECKNPKNYRQVINEYAIEQQVNRYNSVLKPTFQIITNDREVLGKDLRNEEGFDYIPSIVEIIKDNIKYQKSEPHRWNRCPVHLRDVKEVQTDFVELGYISRITDGSIVPNIIQLIDLFYDTTTSFENITLSDKLTLTEDLGLRLSNFGYSGSSGLIGDYRCLIVEQSDGNSRTIGYSIYPQGSRGTYLSISVDNRKGLALELQLDRFIVSNGKTEYKIVHNGVMALGHKGSTPSATVRQYVERKEPFLLESEKVLLGTLKLNKHLKFQQKDVQDFILRTATYAILRDELRKEL